MNERIKELAESVDPLAWGQQHPDDDAWCIKFAELIIKECIDLVEYNSHGAAKDIKEHFGVTE